MERIDPMHPKLWLAFAAAAAIAAAQDADTRIQALEKRVEQLEQSKPGNTAQVTADTTGFTIQSSDGNFLLKVGADLQLDNRSFVGEGSDALADSIVLRRVRPTFSGTVYKYVDYFFRPDFGLGQALIYDAYIQLNYFSRLQLRVGKFKPPVGLERLQSDDDTSFVERGLPTLLAPARDIGYQLGGDLVKHRLAYQAGVFNGVPDNSLSDAAATSHRDYAARLFLTPFLPDENRLSGIGVGMGASSGSVDGLPMPSFKTVGQSSFLPFAPGVIEAGHRTRLSPQGYYYLGPFGLLAEYGVNKEGLQKGSMRREVAFRSWQAQASYILTGEKKGFASPTPKKPFDPAHRGWGAIELAARVGDFEAEKDLYNYGFASTLNAARHAHEWVGSVNWYLNRLVRISSSYGDTKFGGGNTPDRGGNRPEERVLLLRFQINFI